VPIPARAPAQATHAHDQRAYDETADDGRPDEHQAHEEIIAQLGGIEPDLADQVEEHGQECERAERHGAGETPLTRDPPAFGRRAPLSIAVTVGFRRRPAGTFMVARLSVRCDPQGARPGVLPADRTPFRKAPDGYENTRLGAGAAEQVRRTPHLI